MKRLSALAQQLDELDHRSGITWRAHGTHLYLLSGVQEEKCQFSVGSILLELASFFLQKVFHPLVSPWVRAAFLVFNFSIIVGKTVSIKAASFFM